MILLQALSLIKAKHDRQRGLPLSGLTQAVLMDWTDAGATVALIVRGPDAWKIEREFVVRWPEDNREPGRISRRSKLLTEALALNQVTSRNVIISVPRRSAVIKLLELPIVTHDILSDAVILQAEARGNSVEEYVVDYIAQPGTTDGAMHVLMAAYPRQLIDEVRETISQIGLTTISIGIGELGLAGALPKSETANPGLLLVAQSESIDFIVTRYGRPISSLTLPLSADSLNYENVLSATLSRLFLSLPQALVADGLESIVAVGPAAASAVSALRTKHSISIQQLETPSPGILRSWGLAIDQNQAECRIDFQKPKQRHDASAAKQKQRIRWMVRGGLAVALAFVCFRFYLSQLDARTEQLTIELATMEHQAQAQEDVLLSADSLAAWQTSKVNWSRELVGFLKPLPDNKRVFINRLRVEQGQNQVPDIRIEGLARILDDAIELNQRLTTQSTRYRLRPDNIDRRDQDPHYQVGFVVSAEVDVEADLFPLSPNEQGNQ